MATAPSVVTQRRVGRLHIRAGAEQDARHATVLITDALRTASLPGAERERLVVIRRLALGRIALRGSAASVALQLEQAARDAATEAVTIESVAAAEANAVMCADRAHALCALAHALASGGRDDQWFWPMVVPGWNPKASRGARWIHLMDAAHGSADAIVLAAAVLDEAMRAGGHDELLGAIVAGAGARWLRLEGWAQHTPAPGAEPWQPRSARSAGMVRQWSNAWGQNDDRTIWLATLVACIERPTSIGDPCLPARIASGIARMNVLAPRTSGPEETEPVARQRTMDDNHASVNDSLGTPIPGQTDRVAHDAVVPQPDPEAHVVIDGASRPAGVDLSADPAEDFLPPDLDSQSVTAANGEAFFTNFAGIYFVVPILERLHFGAFLAAHPELVDDAFATRLIWFIARRAGLPATDPLARALELQCGAPADVGIRGSARWRWPAPMEQVLAAPVPRVSLSSPEVAWLTAVRRWCRRRAGIGLKTLILRPGRLQMSRTHIETRFALSELDLRVRRCALDVDPGWVPWLAHVVRFRYGERDDR